jgi:7-cyano-7-deazaguanine synthase in queuosine biosynthesis
MAQKRLDCLHPDKTFCGECDNCIEWDRTFDHESYEEEKRARIAEQNEY